MIAIWPNLGFKTFLCSKSTVNNMLIMSHKWLLRTWNKSNAVRYVQKCKAHTGFQTLRTRKECKISITFILVICWHFRYTVINKIYYFLLLENVFTRKLKIRLYFYWTAPFQIIFKIYFLNLKFLFLTFLIIKMIHIHLDNTKEH